MRDTNATLATAVSQAADTIMLTDPSGVIQYVNPAFESMSGYAPAEVVGRHVRILKSGTHDAEFYRTLWTTLCHGMVWSGTFVNRRKDGRLYQDQTVISPVRDGSGRVVSYLAVKRDVTRDRREDVRLRQAQKIDAIGRLAGGLAHDFNNVLMTIMGHAEMLEHRVRQTGTSAEEIAEIKGACDRAASITRQLLAFGRRQVRDVMVVDVNRIVVGLEKMLRRLLGEDIRLSVTPLPRPAQVRFEFGQLEQIIMALAVRAREVMPSGVFSVTVRDSESAPDGEPGATPREAADRIAVCVADTGSDLDAETPEQFFEPLQESTLQSWGTGLALATAHALVEQTGGHIFVRSGAAGGTVFTISLPRAAPEDASAGVARESRKLSGAETVLLAEDEDGVRELVRTGLMRLGYRVIDAPDGRTALERAANHAGHIDLLITDVVMPGMTARELADRLRALHPAVKIVYMSGYPDAAIAGHGVWGAGAVFLQKPFTPEALARTVRGVLD